MALVLLLRKVKSDPGASVALENFDDISFHSGGNVLEQLQTKLVSAKSLTDTSVDLWKTLRVRSEQFHQGSLDPASTTLTLLTTAEAPIGSAAAYLRVENSYHSKAVGILEKITSQSKNAANQKGFQAFNRLLKTRRSQLVRSVYVLNKSPDMTEAGNLLRHGTRYEYELTTMGKDLATLMTALQQWGDRWIFGEGHEPLLILDPRSGRRVPQVRILDHEGRPLAGREMALAPGPGASKRTRARYGAT